jgi:hypothetical protein
MRMRQLLAHELMKLGLDNIFIVCYNVLTLAER